MANDHRYRPQKLRGGVVVQSGVDLKPRSTQRYRLMDPALRPFRAVVVNSRVIDEAGHVRGIAVECDVILVRTQLSIQNVPVLQRQYGINNVHDLWVPRPTTRSLDDSDLNVNRTVSSRGTFVAPATSLGELDGDMVLVDFMEGNKDFPIIVGALPHERSNRVLTSGIGWREGSVAERGAPKRDEYYTHHYGAEVRINEQGDLLVDTVNAYADPATEDAGAASGQVRFRIKDSQRLTVAIGDDEDVFEVWKDGGQLRVDLGEGATERIVLGDSFRTFLNNFFSVAFDTHTHVAPVGGSTGPPNTAPVATMGDALLSDLSKTKKT